MTSDAVENLLRTEWWVNHGCAEHAQYGDDGEMQCAECLTDFKRSPLDDLAVHVGQRRAVQTLISIKCIEAQILIDNDRFDDASAVLDEAQNLARPEHPKIFYLRQLIPPPDPRRAL